MAENDVSFLLGNRLNQFDIEYAERKVDYTVPKHISEFESSSDKWVRQNLKNNNLIMLQMGNTDYEAREQVSDSGSIINKLEGHERSIFTDMNSSDLNQEDTRILDYRLKEINTGIIKNLLNEDEIKLNQDSDPYKNVIHKLAATDLLKGIQEINHISNIFFSDINIKAINQAIKSNIKKITGNSINDQINNSLFIIMRSIYLQYSKNIQSNDVLAEIKYLNKLVINYCVEQITNELVAYNSYLQNINNLPIPMDNPHDTSTDWRNYTYDMSNII